MDRVIRRSLALSYSGAQGIYSGVRPDIHLYIHFLSLDLFFDCLSLCFAVCVMRADTYPTYRLPKSSFSSPKSLSIFRFPSLECPILHIFISSYDNDILFSFLVITLCMTRVGPITQSIQCLAITWLIIKLSNSLNKSIEGIRYFNEDTWLYGTRCQTVPETRAGCDCPFIAMYQAVCMIACTDPDPL